MGSWPYLPLPSSAFIAHADCWLAETMSRQTIDIKLLWSEQSPMDLCFNEPKNEIFTSDWTPLAPALPNAQIVSQSAIHFDILPSGDNTSRWSFEAEMNPEGSAVRAIIRRWCGTLPKGLVIRIVVDNMEWQVQQLMEDMQRMAGVQHSTFAKRFIG